MMYLGLSVFSTVVVFYVLNMRYILTVVLHLIFTFFSILFANRLCLSNIIVKNFYKNTVLSLFFGWTIYFYFEER